MKKGLTARKLRIVLIISMLLIAAAATAGFMYAKAGLDDYAQAISRLNADAQSGNTNILTLKKLQTRLDSEQAVINDARNIVASSSNYTDTVIDNISSIARNSGVSVSSISFLDDSTTAAAAAPTATPGTPATPGTTTAPTASGVTKKTVSVTIGSPLSYDALITFLKNLESNDLKMQPTSVSMTKDKGNLVSTQPFTIEVYVR